MVPFHSPLLKDIQARISKCHACPRLRRHCQKVAQEKRRAYLQDTYWGLPVSGFGDPKARMIVVGLAPAAHGANRTGRIFTGDRSGDWLYRALHRAGFANQPESIHRQDGLELLDAYVTCVVHCAPPENKPSPKEIETCVSAHLLPEMSALTHAKVWIALGQIAFSQLWRIFAPDLSRPRFKHGLSFDLPEQKTLLTSFHPSQQNTFTGKLTEPMFDAVFNKARHILESPSPAPTQRPRLR